MQQLDNAATAKVLEAHVARGPRKKQQQCVAVIFRIGCDGITARDVEGFKYIPSDEASPDERLV